MVTVTNSTTIQQLQKHALQLVLQSLPTKKIVTKYAYSVKNATSNHASRDAIHYSIVIEWLCMETVSRGEMCRIILLNLLQTFDPDVCNNKHCITSLSITKCIASTLKTG